VSQLLDAWPKVGFWPQLAVLLLGCAAVAMVIGLARNARRRADSSESIGVRSTARVPAWVWLEVAAFVVALVLFVRGWLVNVSSIDCAGAACAEGIAELRAAHRPFEMLLVIPVLGVVWWLVGSQRARKHGHDDA
jgi:hypothetical protein